MLRTIIAKFCVSACDHDGLRAKTYVRDICLAEQWWAEEGGDVVEVGHVGLWGSPSVMSFDYMIFVQLINGLVWVRHTQTFMIFIGSSNIGRCSCKSRIGVTTTLGYWLSLVYMFKRESLRSYVLSLYIAALHVMRYTFWKGYNEP